MVSVLETHRYTVEPDGLLIRAPAARGPVSGNGMTVEGEESKGADEEKGPPDAGSGFNFNTGSDALGGDNRVRSPRPPPEYVEPWTCVFLRTRRYLADLAGQALVVVAAPALLVLLESKAIALEKRKNKRSTATSSR